MATGEVLRLLAHDNLCMIQVDAGILQDLLRGENLLLGLRLQVMLLPWIWLKGKATLFLAGVQSFDGLTALMCNFLGFCESALKRNYAAWCISVPKIFGKLQN